MSGVGHLLAADRVRFGRRWDLRIVVALVPIILAIMFVSEFKSVTTPPDSQFFVTDPPDPALEAEFQAQMLADWRQQLTVELPAFAFPASLVKVAGNFGPMVLLALYLATALVAGEFEWGTVRTLHLTSSRGRTLAVRILVVAGLIGVVVSVGLVFAAILPFLLSVEGRPLQDFAAPVPDLWPQVATRLLILLPSIAIPAFMAVLARSTGAAFLLTVLLFFADVAITGAPVWVGTPASWVPAVTVTGATTRLLAGPDSQLAPIAPSWVSIVALVLWAVVPVVVAIARFRRLDLNE
jgi:ABC-2 family transporter protein